MTPLIVAHRGASYDAPENTLAAFQLAFEQGADAIEGDFHLTADGEVVCIHDERTGRCGDRDLFVPFSKLAMLREVDVGAWKSSAFAGERMPTLDEVLAVVPPGKKIFIELKRGAHLVPAVAKVIARSGLSADQILLISFEVDKLRQCKDLLPDQKRSLLISYRGSDRSGWMPDPYFAWLAVGNYADCLGVRADRSGVPFPLLRRLRGGQIELHVWTVDDLAAGDAFRALGVASITTNRPALFVQHWSTPPLP